MTRKLIQTNHTWRLYAEVKLNPDRNKFSLVSIMPTARNPDWHNQLVLSLTDAELLAMRDFFIEACAEKFSPPL